MLWCLYMRFCWLLHAYAFLISCVFFFCMLVDGYVVGGIVVAVGIIVIIIAICIYYFDQRKQLQVNCNCISIKILDYDKQNVSNKMMQAYTMSRSTATNSPNYPNFPSFPNFPDPGLKTTSINIDKTRDIEIIQLPTAPTMATVATRGAGAALASALESKFNSNVNTNSGGSTNINTITTDNVNLALPGEFKDIIINEGEEYVDDKDNLNQNWNDIDNGLEEDELEDDDNDDDDDDDDSDALFDIHLTMGGMGTVSTQNGTRTRALTNDRDVVTINASRNDYSHPKAGQGINISVKSARDRMDNTKNTDRMPSQTTNSGKNEHDQRGHGQDYQNMDHGERVNDSIASPRSEGKERSGNLFT